MTSRVSGASSEGDEGSPLGAQARPIAGDAPSAADASTTTDARTAATEPAPAIDLRRYAEITIELGVGERAAVLARHGLDEDTWDAIEEAWQGRLSAELEAWEEDGVPPLLTQLEAAQSAARARVAGDQVLALEKFAGAVREMARGGDPMAALARAGVSPADFARASSVWTARLAIEPELAARFAEVVGGVRKR